MVMFLRMHARMNALIVWRGLDLYFWTHPHSFPSCPQAGVRSLGSLAEEVFCLFVEWMMMLSAYVFFECCWYIAVIPPHCQNVYCLLNLLFARSLIICGVFISFFFAQFRASVSMFSVVCRAPVSYYWLVGHLRPYYWLFGHLRC